ncbi:hypothetical protein [Streptomyces sp. NPDC012450]|uniref:hypothetical protein n=1 Tax=Streptomyces sp. NPDC012450 TaxID=3364834 RepID=UPI0036E9CF44
MSDKTIPAHRAHHTGAITLTRQGIEPESTLGATTWWPDGTTSYVLHFRGSRPHSLTVADETDTAIQALDALRAGEELSGELLWEAIRDVRRLRSRLEALEGELVLYAREEGPEGRPRLSLRDLGEVTHTHHTTVAERVERMKRGVHAAFRNWLVHQTPRALMHTGGCDCAAGRDIEPRPHSLDCVSRIRQTPEV